MSKKILPLLLVLVLTLCAFALTACGGGDAVDMGAYILTDKATYLTYKNNAEGDKLPNLKILYENDASLKNTYTMIAVDADGTGFTAAQDLNEIGADCFIKWMSLASTRTLIAEYGKAQAFGENLFTLQANAQTYAGEVSAITKAGSGATDAVVTISTTTSVNDSKLLTFLEPVFEEATGFDMQWTSVGTGAAIQAAKDGNADLILVHSASQEKTFIDGHFARTVEGLTGDVVDASYPQRVVFMYNFFVVVGSKADPAKVAACATVLDAFKAIGNGGYNFVSRGDTSGTHTAEVKLWTNTEAFTMVNIDLAYTSKGVEKTGTSTAPGADGKAASWYVSAGQGMGACLTMANELKAKG